MGEARDDTKTARMAHLHKQDSVYNVYTILWEKWRRNLKNEEKIGWGFKYLGWLKLSRLHILKKGYFCLSW